MTRSLLCYFFTQEKGEHMSVHVNMNVCKSVLFDNQRTEIT